MRSGLLPKSSIYTGPTPPEEGTEMTSSDARVTDADIQAILERGEAGIADLLAAYEPIEHQYYSSVQAGAAIQVMTTIDTYPR